MHENKACRSVFAAPAATNSRPWGYWKSFRHRINTDDIGNVIAFAPFGKHLYDDIGSEPGFRLLVEHTVNWVVESVPLVFPIKQ